jgi:hypothetical protein
MHSPRTGSLYEYFSDPKRLRLPYNSTHRFCQHLPGHLRARRWVGRLPDGWMMPRSTMVVAPG